MRYLPAVVCAFLAFTAECGFGDPATPKGQPENRTLPAMKTKKVRLADGAQVEVEDYGDTYLGYDFREPYHANDLLLPQKLKFSREVKTVVDYHDRTKRLQNNLHLRSLLLDEKNKKLYWIDTNYSDTAAHLRRASLDGSRIETLVSKLLDPRGLALDLKHKKVYWTVGIPGTIQRANLDGSKIEDVVTGLQGPAGLAVSPERDVLYFAEHGKGRIFRSRLDGSDRTLLIDSHRALHLLLEETTRKLYWNDREEHIFRADLDGTNIESVVRLSKGTGKIIGFDVDIVNGKVYFNASGAIRRANLDGSQMEDVAIGVPPNGEIDGLVIDQSTDQIYWVETVQHDDSRDQYGRIRRVKIPPLLRAVEKPSPPLIEGIDPQRQAAQGKIRLAGQHFAGTSRVIVAGIGTGEFTEAKFKVISRETIELTVPNLRSHCDEAAIIVMSPSGVTVTMPTSSLAVGAKRTIDGLAFDPWKEGQKFALLANSGGTVGGMERCLAYIASGGTAFSGRGGSNIVFVKNGATSSCSGQRKSLIFSEPFGIVTFRDEALTDTKLIPVSAIQPSFLKELFKPQ